MESRAPGQAASPPVRVRFPDHIHIADCYQCGKCTAGCPVSQDMDLAPNQVVRLMQLDHWERAVRSQAIWECLGCQTCSTRCPKSVDCAGIMDALREVALVHKMASRARLPEISFQESFLENIRRNGRLNELELIGSFKAKVVIGTGRLWFLFKDAGLAPQLSRRKKLHFLPEKARDRKIVERIFARCSNRTEP